MSEPVVAVHVGAHKTGTSVLQGWLAAHRRTTLLRHRVRYQSRNDIGEFVGRWGERLTTDPEPFGTHLEQLASSRWFRTIVVSHEDLVGRPFAARGRGRLYPHAPATIAGVGRALAGRNARIVLSLRPQHEFVESCYLQTVHQGRHHRFQDWFGTLDPGALSWRPLVEAAHAAVGAANTVVIDFARLRAGQDVFVEHVLRRVDPRLQLPVHHAEQHNRSLSARGLEIALAVNPLLETDDERRAVRELLQHHFPNTLSPRPTLLTDAQRTDLVARYEQEYAELVAD